MYSDGLLALMFEKFIGLPDRILLLSGERGLLSDMVESLWI